MTMKQRQLLAAMNAIFGVVNVEHQSSRHMFKTIAEQFDPLDGLLAVVIS